MKENKLVCEPKYVPISDEEKKKNIQALNALIGFFLKENDYVVDNLSVNVLALSRIVDKVHQRKQYFSYFHDLDMSELKQIALTAFWIIKLYPIDTVSNLSKERQNDLKSINEKFALFYIIVYLKILYKDEHNDNAERIDKFFDDLYIRELEYSFTYRDISKEAMILLVETIAKGVGIQPYKTSEN